ncbi:hypothetical protein ACVGVM_12805 [Pseudonocardia bannensis]|uniref:Uncharacterized protein n=1 Tax=Pseudonocardia bannensis TaxID=630973 RepID=A0A848DKJ4_9PSEU|nr:hypothetical protein [Pseudonocardia bannensis]NMH93085.1 hypothetical protein [Pseudonocardia bannensis]
MRPGGRCPATIAAGFTNPGDASVVRDEQHVVDHDIALGTSTRIRQG